jgi:hypothetical protein
MSQFSTTGEFSFAENPRTLQAKERTMRKMIVSTPLLVFAVALLFAAAFMAVPAKADNAHFVKGPTCTVSLTTGLTCTGTVAGLGTTPDGAFLTDTSTVATFICQNHGKNVAPGQPIPPAGTQTGPQGSITAKGGNTIFTASLPVPPTPSPTSAFCPNDNWSLVLTSLTFNNVSVHFTTGGVEVTGSPLSIGTFTGP